MFSLISGIHCHRPDNDPLRHDNELGVTRGSKTSLSIGILSSSRFGETRISRLARKSHELKRLWDFRVIEAFRERLGKELDLKGRQIGRGLLAAVCQRCGLAAAFFGLLKRFTIVTGMAVLLCAKTAKATPSFVQGNYADPQTPQATVNVSYTRAQAAGDLNVVVVGWNDTNAQVNSVT